jgi:sporulation protein YlmC with PRC-barrel domain
MIDQSSVPSLMGSTVRDGKGDKIGKVGQVYLDDATGQPEWVTVRTGLFGTHESFVPLAAARVEGDELVVDVPKEKVTDAPRIDEDGHLSEEQETELYSYYGVSPAGFGRDTGPTESGYAGPPGYATGTGGVNPEEYPGRSVAPETRSAPEGTYAPDASYPGTPTGGSAEPRTDHAGTLDSDVEAIRRDDSPATTGTGLGTDTSAPGGTSRQDDAATRGEDEVAVAPDSESRRARLRRYAPPGGGTTPDVP